MKLKERTKKIINLLEKKYSQSSTALKHDNPFELLIATILSAQCTDEQVNKVTAKLFDKYKTVESYYTVPIEELEQDIKSTGFYRNKAKNIQSTAKKLVEDFGGDVPQTLDELVTLPGVARKTANVVLGNAFGIVSGFVVDTHVARLSMRLKLTENKTKNADRIEKDLMEIVPKDRWISFSMQLILHGRNTCKARKPQCDDCLISELCPSKGKLD